MKIYMTTDLEGVSGVMEFDDRVNEAPWNTAVRQRNARLLTGEVNAAVDGAFAGGATEVVVDDAHARGFTIDVELLDERVRILHGRERPRIMAGLDESFAGVLVIGAHAMARTRAGVLYHTMSASVREIRINGRAIGEIGIWAFVAGAFGVPMLLVTGDSAACREAEAFIPGVMTLAVKDGFSRYGAVAWSPGAARRMIRDAAEQAVRRQPQAAPLVFEPPFSYQVDSFPGDADVRVSDPAALPQTWTTGQEIRAATARELIDKGWGKTV